MILELLRTAPIGCFSVYNLETVQAVVEAARSREAPVMLSIGNEAVAHSGLLPLGEAAMAAAGRAPVPVFVHRNHGRDIEHLRAALDMGFPSVMFDGSGFDYGENVRLTRQAVELSKSYGAVVEGELGALDGMIDGGECIDKGLEFVAATGVDILAVSIPKNGACDMQLLKELCRRLPCPVAIHSASRLGPRGAALVSAAGAAKVNFHSEIKQSMQRALDIPHQAPLRRLAAMRRNVEQTVSEKLVLLRETPPHS